ncbi:MAG: RsmE family RNA methyltransferase [Treponema sp.]|nr:RsmE family RNA methyltransferase [Treponema sp.]
MIEVRLSGGELIPMTVCRIDDSLGSILLQECTVTDHVSAMNVARGVSAGDVCEGACTVEYTLFQFIAKPQKMELIIRQAVECGVKTIVPVAGLYSQKSSIDAMRGKILKSERIEHIIREAREQSGSPVETTVHEPIKAAEVAAFWKEISKGFAVEGTTAVVLSERSSFCKPLGRIIKNEFVLKSAAVAVGCEGGISPDEIEMLRNGGFIPVHFACNIMRCETAALYGIAALQTAIMNTYA